MGMKTTTLLWVYIYSNETTTLVRLLKDFANLFLKSIMEMLFHFLLPFFPCRVFIVFGTPDERVESEAVPPVLSQTSTIEGSAGGDMNKVSENAHPVQTRRYTSSAHVECEVHLFLYPLREYSYFLCYSLII